MFETLVESGRQHRSNGRAGAVAFAVHIGIVALAVNQTKAQFLVPPKIIEFELPVYQAAELPREYSTPATTETDIPMPVVPSVDITGPISIDPIAIDPGSPPDLTGELRRSIIDGGRVTGFSVGTPARTTGPIDGILLAAEVDDPVRVLQAAPPRYPRTLEAAGVPGRVVLQFVVDTLGRVELATLTVAEATDSAFARSSRDAIMATKFAPARMHGQAVRQLVRQTHLFRTSE